MYQHNNSINDINFRYIVNVPKNKGFIAKRVNIKYLELIKLLELKKDDLGINYNKGTSRQLQLIQHLLLKTKELNIIKCNVYINDQAIL
jgi:ribosomal protein L14E/L6E/L27E